MNSTKQQAQSPMPPTGKPADQLRSITTQAWDQRIMSNMKRMAQDEAYRQEIAKKQS